MIITEEKIQALLTVARSYGERYELSKTVEADYYEPGMMEYPDRYFCEFDEAAGLLTVRFEIKGTRYEGRTELLEKHSAGDEVFFVRDKENIYNSNNFFVTDKKGQNLGNMPAELCNALAPLFDDGEVGLLSSYISFVEPISKRSRYAKQAILFTELKLKLF